MTVFCPRCGIARTGRVCDGCGYDYVEGAKMPAVTLSRGINPVSLVMGIVAIAVVAGLVLLVIRL
jgi:hypothetical protein